MESFNRFVTFLQESWNEVRHKVTWPSRQEVTGTTIVVVVATVLFGVFLGVVDLGMVMLVRWFFSAVA